MSRQGGVYNEFFVEETTSLRSIQFQICWHSCRRYLLKCIGISVTLKLSGILSISFCRGVYREEFYSAASKQIRTVCKMCVPCWRQSLQCYFRMFSKFTFWFVCLYVLFLYLILLFMKKRSLGKKLPSKWNSNGDSIYKYCI